MPDSVPYLESESHFRRYEKYIIDIVRAWPNTVTFTPLAPVASIETLSSRIRICIKALRNNQFPVSWDFAKFIQICDEIIVSTKATPGKVVCGPYDKLRKIVPLDTKIEVDPISSASPTINITDPSVDLITSII